MLTLTVAPPPSRLRRAWGIATDLLIVTAIIWAIPLLVGVAAALVDLLS